MPTTFRSEHLALTRRELLQRCGMGFGALALGSLLGSGRSAAPPRSPIRCCRRSPHFPAKAKHVIHLFMNGGPSHVDTFDPKPALAKYAGKALPTENLRHRAADRRRVAVAVQVPASTARAASKSASSSRKTAESIDDIAVIRSMHADVPNHEPSLLLMNCGDARQIRPSLGSWVCYGLGSREPEPARRSSRCAPAATRFRKRRTGNRASCPASTKARISTRSTRPSSS